MLLRTYRGVHRLNKDEEGRVKCVACFMCSTACPARCIHIEADEAPWDDREKYPAKFDIDELRCIYCGMCEEACPVDAIELTHSLRHCRPDAAGDDLRQVPSCMRIYDRDGDERADVTQLPAGCRITITYKKSPRCATYSSTASLPSSGRLHRARAVMWEAFFAT
jgi:ferredoxin